MSDIVIAAERLGRKYIISHHAENGRYVALRDVLTHNVGSMWQKAKGAMRGSALGKGDTFEEVWAVRDTSFENREGQVGGVIGRNGVGKSTVLTISRSLLVRSAENEKSLSEMGHHEITGNCRP